MPASAVSGAAVRRLADGQRRLPVGGFKQSGLGRELRPHALDGYTEEKFVTPTCPVG
jgi:acyl-CoA reductase-like NAD-dependent aldehyde dehydrogenase